MKINFKPLVACFGGALLLEACLCGVINEQVSYVSVRTSYHKPQKAPETAKIYVTYTIGADGELLVYVQNLTDQIMVIDQTKSFFVNEHGESLSYYDPTVRTTTTTDLKSGTKGVSVNLGSVAGALGAGSLVSGLLSGVNVGGANSSSRATTNTTYIADLPHVNIGPHGSGLMSKTFHVSSVGSNDLSKVVGNGSFVDLEENESPVRFSVCICYSTDEGKTFQRIVTDMYANSLISVPVESMGRVNESLRKVCELKPSLFYEQWWLLDLGTIKRRAATGDQRVPGTRCCDGILYDYQ